MLHRKTHPSGRDRAHVDLTVRELQARQQSLAAPLPQRKGSPLSDIITAGLLFLGALAERRPGRTHRAWLAAVPIVIVNYVAFRAQLRYWEAYLSHSDALLVSGALESIAIYLAWQAHVAQLADDSALRLRLAAYGMAAGIGVLNYSHYMRPGWKPTAAAVVFGGMSAISPWLWSIHSRRESRDALKRRGLIEPHAVRLGGTRWFYHMYRCLRVMWMATWIGETRPAEAIKLIRQDLILSATGAGDILTEGIADDAASVIRLAPRARGRRRLRKQPLSAPGSRKPEPRHSPSRRRAAGDPGLTAARAALETELIAELVHRPQPWPSARSLADDERLAAVGAEATRRRFAGKIIDAARAMSNGGSDGGHDGS